MKSQARVIFRGRVQGVCFRAFTRDQARSAHLAGWVRNLSDGSVEALFEGEEDQIKSTINKCRQGPPSAFVETIDIAWEKATGQFYSFDIRY